MPRPFGVFLLAIFLSVATCVLVGFGVALAFPGSGCEAIWQLYPARRTLLMPYRVWLVPGFLALAVVTGAASIGCWRQRQWGWRLAIVIFVVNGVGDAGQLAMGRLVEGGVGVAAAGAMLFYLGRPCIRSAFI